VNHVVLPALALGLAYAATPGVVNAECVRRGVARGFRPALLVQLGSLIGDGVWAALALTGVAAWGRSASLSIGLGFVGALFLCRLAFTALRSAWTGPTAARRPESGADFRTGALFGLANPAGIAFWAGIGGGLATTTSDPGGAAFALFLVAFMGGALVWSLGLSALVAWGRRFVRPVVFRVVDACCGLALGYLGVRLFWTTLRRTAAWRSWA
jgi:threonine/homoserine/homoserine lactone efflux protein